MPTSATAQGPVLTARDLAEAYTLDEAAELFRVSRQTLRRWIRNGQLGAVVAGNGSGRLSYVIPRRYAEARLNELNRPPKPRR